MKKILKKIGNVFVSKIIPFVSILGVLASFLLISVGAEAFNVGTDFDSYNAEYDGVLDDKNYPFDTRSAFRPFSYDFSAMTPRMSVNPLTGALRSSIPFFSKFSDVGLFYHTPDADVYNPNNGIWTSGGAEFTVQYVGGFSYLDVVGNRDNGVYLNFMHGGWEDFTYNSSSYTYSTSIAVEATNINQLDAILAGYYDTDWLTPDFGIFPNLPCFYANSVTIPGVVRVDSLDYLNSVILNDFAIAIWVSSDVDVRSYSAGTFVLDTQFNYEFVDVGGNWAVGQNFAYSLSPDSYKEYSRDEVDVYTQVLYDVFDVKLVQCRFNANLLEPMYRMYLDNLFLSPWVRNVRIDYGFAVTDDYSATGHSIWVDDNNSNLISMLDAFGSWPIYRTVLYLSDVPISSYTASDRQFSAWYLEQFGTPVSSECGWFNWLGDAVGGVLDVEIFPGVSFSVILYTVIGFALVFGVLKFFVGG